MFAIDFGTYLSDNGYGTLEEDILIDYMGEKTNSISIFSQGGTLADLTIEGDGSIYNDSVVIYCRDSSRQTAYETLANIEKLVLKETNINIGQTLYLYFWVPSTVSFRERDTEGRYTYYLIINTKKQKD